MALVTPMVHSGVEALSHPREGPPCHVLARPPPRRTPLRAVITAFALALAGLAPLARAPGTGAAPPAPQPGSQAPDLGDRVVVFDPIDADRARSAQRADAIWQQQVDAEMSAASAGACCSGPAPTAPPTEPLQIKVGYYTEVAGLGASPVRHRHQRQGRGLQPLPDRRRRTQPYCVALNNFWRSLSNLTIDVNGTGQDGCRASRELLGDLARPSRCAASTSAAATSR